MPSATFDSGDGSQAAAWWFHGGGALPDTGAGYTADPVLSDIPGTAASAVNVATQVDPAIITTGYWSVIALDRPLDLSTFSDASAVSDEDIVHLAIRIDNPAAVEEIRLYFVCSPFTTGSPLPALPGVGTSFNTSSYVHTYRPSDYAAFAGNLQSLIDAQAAVRATTLNEPFGNIPTENTPGANAWTEFGIVGLPVHRGDFLALGSAGQAGTDWSTVTGIYIYIATNAAVSVNVAFDDCYLTGGYGPDTSEPGAAQYDYRTVNYDPRTGARSNGSAVLAESLWVDALRQSVTVTPTGLPSDSALRQELYRRGGSITDNWRYVTVNTANGGALTDILTDAAILNTDVVPIDHFQPVATVDAAGTTILAQPLPIFFGPFDDGTVCALGDPYRPGHLYACIAGQVDHWPSSGGYAVEVCSPAEELMNGCLVGGAGFVLSRERGYTVHTNLAGGTGIVVTPSGCTPGLAARWGFCEGPGGVYYVARDDIRVTNGNESVVLSDALWPLFHAQAVNGYYPIDWSVPAAIRLSLYDMDLWFLYQDTQGNRQCLIFSLVWKYWRSYSFFRPLAVAYADETQNAQQAQGALQLLLGSTDGNAYTYSGFTDDGTAIAWSLRTGAWSWNLPREEKLLGDLVLEADLQGSTLTAQLLLNLEATANNAQTVVGLTGRNRYVFDPFGTVPQHARTVSLNLSGTAPITAGVTVAWAGIAYATEPEITMNRATTWEPLNQGAGEAYLTGCWIDSDTGGTARTIYVEGLLNGTSVAVATLTVTSDAGRRQWFSWAAQHLDMVRLRPSGDCEPWMLFGCGWLATPEPPRIATWDTGFEALGDTFYTGITIECDTFNVAKTVVVSVDGVDLTPVTVQANGRTVVHIPFGSTSSSYGRLYRLRATDANVGLLYAHKWHVVAQPDEISNWDQGYDDLGDPGDKYITGVLLECLTTGTKTVQVLIDETVVETLSVTSVTRQTQNFHFASGPYRGKIVRLHPTDTAVGRLWSAKWLFSKEPDRTAGFALLNYEDLGVVGDKYLTGIILECDTSNQPKTIQVEVDGVVAETLTVQANGRSVLPFHFASGPYSTAKVVRLKPTDTNPGQLWAFQWLFDPEPVNNAGFGVLNWTLGGTPSDKYIKGVILECDTAGVAKTVLVESDGGVVVATLTVQTTGRRVVEFSFPQVLARVIRLRATDANPGKLYSARWIFDEEPFALSRWESQLLDFNLPDSGWGSIYSADVSLKSTAVVTFSIAVYNAQGTLLQTLTGRDATTGTAGIVSTGGDKQKRYVLFPPAKGVLFKLLFTSADGSPMTLYKEESRLRVQPWSGGQALLKPFGNDDLDLTREMTSSADAATRAGGSAR